MAYITHPAQSLSIRALASALGAAFMRWFVAVGESHARRDQIERLMALSDAQLTARGLTRDTIVMHVYSDRLGL